MTRSERDASVGVGRCFADEDWNGPMRRRMKTRRAAGRVEADRGGGKGGKGGLGEEIGATTYNESRRRRCRIYSRRGL